MDREAYERDLRERQQEHLKNVRRGREWRPCAHDACDQCHGTGIKSNGTSCIHMLHCTCPRCSPQMLKVEPEWETTNERTVTWNKEQTKYLRERLRSVGREL